MIEINEMHAAQEGCALDELHKHAHLSALYDDEFVATAMCSLQWCVYQVGGIVAFVVHCDHFSTQLPCQHSIECAAMLANVAGLAMPAKRRQTQLPHIPSELSHRQALPVVTITAASNAAQSVAEHSDHRTLQALEENDPVISLFVPIQHCDRWRRWHAEQMEIALAFHCALIQNQASLVSQPIARSSSCGNLLYQAALLRQGGNLRPTTTQVLLTLEQLRVVGALDRAVVAVVIECLPEGPTPRLGCNFTEHPMTEFSAWI